MTITKEQLDLIQALERDMHTLAITLARFKKPHIRMTPKVVFGYDETYYEVWLTKHPGVIGDRDTLIMRGNVP